MLKVQGRHKKELPVLTRILMVKSVVLSRSDHQLRWKQLARVSANQSGALAAPFLSLNAIVDAAGLIILFGQHMQMRSCVHEISAVGMFQESSRGAEGSAEIHFRVSPWAGPGSGCHLVAGGGTHSMMSLIAVS